jgi:hypothetical protein
MVFAVGIFLIIIAAKNHDEPGIKYHVLRDIGIALFVAAFVSVAYEFHTRTTLDHEKIEGVLQTVLRSNIPKEAWEQVNTEILQKNVIRRNLEIRLRLRSDPNLSPTQRILAVETTYELFGLRKQPVIYTLQHAVDQEMWNKAVGLPRFESISIGNKTLTDDEIRNAVKEGVFTAAPEQLDSQHPLRVVVRRSEITNKPGTYHLIFSELTQGIKIYFDEGLPPDVAADVKIWSDKGPTTLQPVGSGIWYFDGIMLPGQVLSFRFLNKE